MRILLVTQYFYPENFKSNDIAFELAKRGYHVDALVGIPNYPEGKYYKGYNLFRKRKETVNGVNIYRAFQTPRGKNASAIGLALNYCTYMLSSCFWVVFSFLFKKKYDAIIVVQLSPITQAVPAILLSKLKNIPVYTWVLDIWPDSVISTIGKNKSKFIEKPLTGLTEWVYKNSKRILVSSRGMMHLVCRNRDYSNKLIYFPNWCDDILSMPLEDGEKLPAGFKIMMAGNLNDGVGVDSLVELAKRLSNIKNLWLVFVGGGTREEYFRSQFKGKGIENVIMTGRLPFRRMPALYMQADAMLITLKETTLPHLKSTVPLRMQSYMSAGKPILGMVDGSAKDVINASGSGFCASAGDVDSLTKYIVDEVMRAPESFKQKGMAARRFYELYYQKENCISNLEYYLTHDESCKPPYPVPEV